MRGLMVCRKYSCRPSGTRFLFGGLTPDLRPGLLYAAPTGLGAGASTSFPITPFADCAVTFRQHHRKLYFSVESTEGDEVKIPTRLRRELLLVQVALQAGMGSLRQAQGRLFVGQRTPSSG